jgi:hypothetical protein
MSREWSGSKATAARRLLTPHVESGRAVCPRCGRPILPGQDWDVGHVDDLALGGHPGGRVRAEHALCNRRAGGRLGAQLRRARYTRTRDWLA